MRADAPAADFGADLAQSAARDARREPSVVFRGRSRRRADGQCVRAWSGHDPHRPRRRVYRRGTGFDPRGRECGADLARPANPPRRDRRPRSAFDLYGARRGLALTPPRMTTRTDDSYSRPVESQDDLISVFSGGEKPRDRWRIGTEHEKFVYRIADHSAPS